MGTTRLQDRKDRILLMCKLLEQEKAKGEVDKDKFLSMFMFNSGITRKLAEEYWDIVQGMTRTVKDREFTATAQGFGEFEVTDK